MKQFTIFLKVLLIFLLVLGASGSLYWLGIMPVTAWLVLLNTLIAGVILFFVVQFMLRKKGMKKTNEGNL
jgi:hypothetical protein